MSEARNCSECGGWDDGHDNHHCPGSPNDRLDALETDVFGLEEREDDDRKNLLKALRRVAEYTNRSKQEKTLLLDLADALEDGL